MPLNYAQRLSIIYKTFQPELLGYEEEVLRHYIDKEETLLQALAAKFGCPVPPTEIEGFVPTPPRAAREPADALLCADGRFKYVSPMKPVYDANDDDGSSYRSAIAKLKSMAPVPQPKSFPLPILRPAPPLGRFPVAAKPRPLPLETQITIFVLEEGTSRQQVMLSEERHRTRMLVDMLRQIAILSSDIKGAEETDRQMIEREEERAMMCISEELVVSLNASVARTIERVRLEGEALMQKALLEAPRSVISEESKEKNDIVEWERIHRPYKVGQFASPGMHIGHHEQPAHHLSPVVAYAAGGEGVEHEALRPPVQALAKVALMPVPPLLSIDRIDGRRRWGEEKERLWLHKRMAIEQRDLVATEEAGRMQILGSEARDFLFIESGAIEDRFAIENGLARPRTADIPRCVDDIPYLKCDELKLATAPVTQEEPRMEVAEEAPGLVEEAQVEEFPEAVEAPLADEQSQPITEEPPSDKPVLIEYVNAEEQASPVPAPEAAGEKHRLAADEATSFAEESSPDGEAKSMPPFVTAATPPLTTSLQQAIDAIPQGSTPLEILLRTARIQHSVGGESKYKGLEALRSAALSADNAAELVPNLSKSSLASESQETAPPPAAVTVAESNEVGLIPDIVAKEEVAHPTVETMGQPPVLQENLTHTMENGSIDAETTAINKFISLEPEPENEQFVALTHLSPLDIIAGSLLHAISLDDSQNAAILTAPEARNLLLNGNLKPLFQLAIASTTEKELPKARELLKKFDALPSAEEISKFQAARRKVHHSTWSKLRAGLINDLPFSKKLLQYVIWQTNRHKFARLDLDFERPCRWEPYAASNVAVTMELEAEEAKEILVFEEINRESLILKQLEQAWSMYKEMQAETEVLKNLQ